MTNFPLAILSTALLFVSVDSFRVLPRDENPDLTINDELNLIEPKLDFWHIFLRPRSKSSFKNVLKFLANYDSRDRYTVADSTPILSKSSQTASAPEEVEETKQQEKKIEIVKKDRDNEKLEALRLNQNERNVEIVSTDIGQRESMSNENIERAFLGSISDAESDDKSHSSNVSKEKPVIERDQKSNKNRDSSSEESEEKNVKTKINNARSERIKQLETRLAYEANLPKSLHHFEIDKPRFQHSITGGWIY